MINQVRLVNFKGFRDETIRFGGLTVLSGLNSKGRCSVIQAVPDRLDPIAGAFVAP